MRSKAVFCLTAVAALFHPPLAETNSDDKTLARDFKARLARARLYRAPEFPEGCLDWTTSPKGEDSLWMRPKVAATKACQGIHVEDSWILSRSGGEPFLVSGAHDEERTELAMLSEVPEEEIAGGKAPEEQESDPEEPAEDDQNAIDVILGGGGGSMKKEDRRKSSEQGTITAMGGVGFGGSGRAGWGTGNSSERPRSALSEPHLILEVPDTGDIRTMGKGIRPKEALRRQIMANMGAFRSILETYLKGNPAAVSDPIRLKIEFVVAASGKVVAATVTHSGLANAPLDRDLQERAQLLRFDGLEPSSPQETVIVALRAHRR